MNKLNLESKDMIGNNIELISQLFPHCITEQKGKKVVDFNKLRKEFTNDIVDETKEKYELNWPGKRAAINEASIKTNKTLLPLEEKSIKFDDTNNVYIEGDNLEVLKLLQESYLNKIKCIYIDPPYNTGKDFIYKDDFKQTSEEELIESGQVDEDGNKFVQNTETNGRYHSDWLSMMYPRLKLARNLLKEDGVIFISIDDNEYDNLKKLCDEIFGENNFVECFQYVKTETPNSLSNKVRNNVEQILCYEKKKNNNEYFSHYIKEEFSDAPLNNNSNRKQTIKFPINSLYFPNEKDKKVSIDNVPLIIKGYYNANEFSYELNSKWSQTKIDEEVLKGTKFNVKNLETFSIRYMQSNEGKFLKPKTLISSKDDNIEVGTNETAAREISKLLGGKYFDTPKDIKLLSYLINMSKESDEIILDFFSGSSSTAHATMQMNAINNERKKYIMVQLPETIDEKNSKAAYDFCIENDLEPIIPSIAQERIKRAGAKIKEETGADIDYGFRVFKLSDSILKANEVLPSDLQQDLLSESDSKYVDGVSKLDIVTSVILDLGLMLDSKIENIGNDNFIVEEDLLFISLSEEYDSGILDSIRDIMPDQVVLDEKTFAGNDALMTNVIQQINEINSDITINIL